MGDRLQAGKPYWYVTSHPGQLSLAIPPWVGAMSTSASWDVNRHTAWCTSPVSVVWQCKLVSGWGLKKRRSAPPYGPYGSVRTSLYICIISLLVIFFVAVFFLVSVLAISFFFSFMISGFYLRHNLSVSRFFFCFWHSITCSISLISVPLKLF